MAKRNWIHKFVIYRVDSYVREDGRLGSTITIKEVLDSKVEADAEVARLSQLVLDKHGIEYHCQVAKYFPGDRTGDQ